MAMAMAMAMAMPMLSYALYPISVTDYIGLGLYTVRQVHVYTSKNRYRGTPSSLRHLP